MISKKLSLNKVCIILATTMELPQIITKTLREILWFNYMEQMIFC